MFLDFLFPRFCIGCKRIGKYLCTSCCQKLGAINVDVCSTCQKPSFMGETHKSCVGVLDGVLSIFEYKGLMRDIIKTVKYNLVYAVWDELVERIPQERIHTLQLFKKRHTASFLQVIPLHDKRFKMRGFNQVKPFESYISSLLKYNSVHILKRVKNTSPQVLMKDKNERTKNMKGAFNVDLNNNINEINEVILLDDVFTTGNTCREAASVLKSAGVKKVFVITLARG